MEKIEVMYNVYIGGNKELESLLYKALDEITDGDQPAFRKAVEKWVKATVDWMDEVLDGPAPYEEDPYDAMVDKEIMNRR